VPPDNLPQGPIDNMIVDEAGNGFWISSAQVLYHTDANLKEWRKVVNLGGRWIGGRRLSVGNTPTVNRLIDDSAQPGSLIAIMGRDGLERVTGETVESSFFADQLEGEIGEIWNTSSGWSLVDTEFLHHLWRYQGERWHRMGLTPERHPADSNAVWEYAEPFRDQDGVIDAFVSDSSFHSEELLTRIDSGGIVEERYKWQSDTLYFDTSFLIASDGNILMSSNGKLWLRKAGAWVEVGSSDLSYAVDRVPRGPCRRILPLGRAHDADFFLDAAFGDLYSLTRTSDAQNSYHLSLAKSTVHSVPSGINDAFVDRDGSILMATADNLIRFHLDDGRSEIILPPHPGENIESLCRDDEGRLWAIGQRLYISASDGKQWTVVDLPMLNRQSGKEVRPRSGISHGVLVTLYNRGAVFLDWD
jgi:hypothetical protein